MADKIKLVIAVLVMAGALAGFYIFSEQALVFRVLGLLAGVIVAGFIAAQSSVGSSAVAYTRGAVIEVRKVVWPTRKETVQTTMMVMVMVLVVGLILWGFDSLLALGVEMLTGQGS